MTDLSHLRGKAACVGIATHGTGESPGWNSTELMGVAVLKALDDAGLTLDQVDGIWAATAVHSMAAMSLAEYLGIQPKFSSGSNIGGSSFLAHALDAAMALEAGLVDVAVIAYGSNQRTAGGFRSRLRAHALRGAVYQPRNPITAYALAASRYMHEYGATREHLAEVAVAARAWASHNPEAFTRDPITVDDVLAARPDLGPARQARLLPRDRRRRRRRDGARRPGEGLSEARLPARRRHGARPPDDQPDAVADHDLRRRLRQARLRHGGLWPGRT